MFLIRKGVDLAQDGTWKRLSMWEGISEEEWNDWRWQLKNRITTAEQLKKIITLTPEEEEGIKHSGGRLSMAITPYFAQLIDPDKPYCPLRRQAVPAKEEFIIGPNDRDDPLAEEQDSPVKNLVHRYPDRVLVLATDQCAMYCRHCTRRRMVGVEEQEITPLDLTKICDYLKSNRKIRDVLLSGGDPLLLPDERLEEVLKSIKSVSNIDFLRIGTRVPVTLPQRITEDLINILKKYSPIWLSIHFNHPKEITKSCKRACDLLSDAGIPLGSQTVLLHGINDRLYIMKKLMQELLKIRVRPYYIYQCDMAKGIGHFRTSVACGYSIIEKMRGHTSGYAVPTYVIDAPGGGGKIPLMPDYLTYQAKGTFYLRNYEGKVYAYTEEPDRVSPQLKKDIEEIIPEEIKVATADAEKIK
ncbi:MAG: KamA family radical SAM protein [Candidatus Omnitrophota bacterium]